MSAVEIWITIVAMTVITVATRTVMLVFGDRIPLPERVQHALRFAPACALSALIAPELLTEQGAWAISLANAKLVGGAVAIAVMLATRSMMATMGIGMAAYFVVRHFV
ncbi:MAG: AzlD domain-containing protein [Burkholderiales bacterium]|jgi:branched-subunit amino acid transport protein|nr:AzlD domain-containing protein [Burkholderiales bacterium]